MIALLAQGLSLGLSASLSPGPFQAFLANRTGRHGTVRTLPLATAPLISDVPIIVLVLFALTSLPDGFLLTLRVAGGAFMIFLGTRSILTRRSTPDDAGPNAAGRRGPATPAAKGRSGFAKALLMNALSPGPYLFWSVLAGPIVVDAWDGSRGGAVAFVLAFYVTLIGGFMAVVALIGLMSRGGERLTRGVVVLTGAALVGFGAYQILHGTGLL